MPFPTQTLNLLGKIDSFSASGTTIWVLRVHILLRRGFGLGHGGRGYLAIALVTVEIILVQITGSRLQLFLTCFFGCQQKKLVTEKIHVAAKCEVTLF